MKTKAITMIMIMLFLASVLSMAFVAPVAATPDSGLVGRWHFDEGSGSTASDSSGNLNHGTLSGGKFGNALYFDGSGDYVEVLSDSSIAPPSITVEAWVKGAGPLGAYKYIISKYYIAAAGGYSSYAFYTGSTGGLYFYVGTNKGYKISGNAGTSIWDGNWHHIAGTYDDSTEVLQFYVDGQRITNIDYGTDINIVYDNGNLYFGNYRPVWLPYDSFKGYIDEVRISNTIKYTGVSFTPPSSAFDIESDTLGLWHFDESVGDKAYDETTNDNDGTIYGAKWAGPIWTTNAKFGSWALSFDGDNDYVRVAPSSTIGLTDRVTVTAWIKPTGLGAANPPYGDVVREQFGYELSLTPTGKVEIALRRGGSWSWFDSLTTVPIPSTEYHFVAFTFDKNGGVNNLKIYIDDMVTPDAQFTIGSTPLDAGGPLGIGAAPHAGSYWWYEGLIDEVSIWNVVLPFHLKFAETSASVAAINTAATLTTILTDDNGNPVEGVKVAFTGATELTFEPTAQATGSDGSASTAATGASVGVYTVTATVETPFGTVSSDWTLVIYDPTAGFVTGGGWIYSPAGAYMDDPTLEGKATFGFVSKYQKGATTPTGQTQFVFHAAFMTFHSTSYEWLVVAGARAQYKGTGTINGVGGYSFILTAIDGQINGGNGIDRFRIKIWDGEGIVYDNMLGQDELDPTAISGGSIVIHTK